MRKLNIYLFVFLMLLAYASLHSQTTKTVGTGGNYSTLQSAFTEINNKTLTGAINLQMISSTTETGTATLLGSGELGVAITNQGGTNYTSTPTVTFSSPPSGTTATGTATVYLGKVIGITITNRGSGYTEPPTVTITGGGGSGATAVAYIPSYTSVNIYPTVSGVTISGNFNTPLIDLDGADNVTIDGRVNQTGSTADMIIANTISLLNYAAPAHTIRFINEATNNTIRYANLRNNTTSTSTDIWISSIILFSTSSTGTAGNSNNTIEYCKLTKHDSNRPDGIRSEGSSTALNQNNVIRFNEIFNLFRRFYRGVYIKSNSGNFKIEGNSFYETETPSVATGGTTEYLSCIYIKAGAHTITGNYFGGSAALAGGSNPWRHTQEGSPAQVFYAIYIDALSGTNSIQGNVITNFNISGANFNGLTAMYIMNGNADIGTVTGNTIGSSTVEDVIQCTGNFIGIWHQSGGTVNIKNNIIGGFKSTRTNSFYTRVGGIYKPGDLGDIQNNTIINLKGNTTGTADQDIFGIQHYGSNTSANISGNNISYLTNSNTGNYSSGFVSGIILGNSSSISIHSNTISNLSNSNANISVSNTASVVGIAGNLYGGNNNIYGNIISNLQQTRSDFTGAVIGIYAAASDSNSIVARNFVHSLAVNSSSSGASMYGILSTNYFGNNNGIYSNNIISIGGNTNSKIFGIAQTSGLAKFYFNTVYISGSPATGSNNTYAFYNNTSTVRNLRNNIFTNTRSNNGATGKHYAIALTSKTSLTIDFNNYYAPGSGGVIGVFNSTDKTSIGDWKIATSQDCGSLNADPVFASAGGTSAANYLPSAANFKAENGTGITSDYGNTVTRDATNPSMGAWEYIVTPGTFPQVGITSFSPSTAGVNSVVTIIGSNFYGITSISFNGGSAIDYTVNSPTEISVTVPASASNGKISVTSSCGGSSISTQDITINGRLNGVYTVGDGGSNYSTISDAVTDLNAKGVDGPVTFLLNKVSEDIGANALTINTIYGSSPTNTVTIKPNTGVTTIITSSSANGTFVIDKANYLILDGSNGTCSERKLIIKNTSSDAASTVLIKGGGNNTVKNCIISGGNSGVYVQKDAGNNPSVNNLISGNEIFQDANVYASYSSPVSETAAGIFLDDGARNTVIDKNIIHDIYYKEIVEINADGWSYGFDNGFGLSGIKVNITSDDAASGSTVIKNNSIYNINGTGGFSTSMDNFVQGIYLKSGGNVKIYFNSVYLTVSNLGLVSWNSYDCISACLGIGSGVTNLDVRNNIFQNSMSKSSGSSKTVKTYAFYTASANTAFDNINYNDYFLEAQTGVTQNLGYLSSDRATLSDLQTATGKDVNSKSKLVNFFSSTVLRLTGSSLGDMDLAGEPISGITTDIICNARNNPPYIGAYEMTNNPLPVELSSFTSSVNNRNVRLNWSTSSEQNNSGFFIERINNEELIVNNWMNIGFVKGSGTTNTSKNYAFEDRGLSTGKYQYRLKQVDFNGNFEYHTLSGEVEIGVPSKFELGQNYPNPFNPSTKIDFSLPVDSKVSLMVYDISGREVKRIMNNEFTKAGYHTAQFNATGLSSGVYFYRIAAGNNVMSKKMLLIK